jgi:hypothetical protein
MEHESEVHMQLLVRVKERVAGMIGDEIKFDLLKTAEHQHVLDYTGRRFAAHTHEFKAMPVQAQWMDVVAGVTEFQPVATRVPCTPALSPSLRRPGR